MASQTPCSVVLFGPQSTNTTKEKLGLMRDSLTSSPLLRPLLETISELHNLGDLLEISDPELKLIETAKTSQWLSNWIQGNDEAILSAEGSRPNAVATPLTVLHHILLFSQQQRGAQDLGLSFGDDVSAIITPETKFEGFCVGKLAATAVRLASSPSAEGEQLAIVASKAVKLAFCVGAYIDLDRQKLDSENEPRCVVVSSHGQDQEEQLAAILTAFDTAYISIQQDQRSTITVGKAQVTELTEKLSTNGFQVKPIDLAGRFHRSDMSWAVEKILEFTSRQSGQLDLLPDEPLTDILKSIMEIPEDWSSTLSQALSQESPTAENTSNPSLVYQIGDNVVSSSLARKLSIKVGGVESLSTPNASAPKVNGWTTDPSSIPYNIDEAVAITGVACRFAEADSLQELWDILESGRSTYRDLPEDRFPSYRFERRDWPKKFKCNTLNSLEEFDHRFFGISSREAVFMDPQQRLALEVTYQALESAGYFNGHDTPDTGMGRDVGCFMGACTNDYFDNVSTHAPSAFSLTGSVRPFIAGKLSHHFGWTGPATSTDTACAASGTAIHQACRAIVTGECSAAIAGGTNIFCSPETFQNLACGHFISTTGPSRSFDVGGDGYCRGEGVAILVLKKLSDALRDGDPIKGVIAATAVNQCYNEASITVPHAPSQMSLYRKALDRAGLDPRSITYVEAHGTGTPVGDPIEASSIRGVFGDHARQAPDPPITYLGSIKSNIGHTEATSGLSGLIKVLLMIENSTIPQQALFKTLNPTIPALEPSGITITKKNVPWTASFKAACINNYGASGTNATMIVTQPPIRNGAASLIEKSKSLAEAVYPVSITAFSPSSLTRYASALLEFVNKKESSGKDTVDLFRDVSFHLSRKRNNNLPYSAHGTVSSLKELKEFLKSTAVKEVAKKTAKKSGDKQDQKPVVLLFGGQTGKTASIPRSLYDSSTVFRKHLDECDVALQELGLPSLFPAIFEAGPHDDVITTHSILFAGQYASALAWIDSGLKPARLVGHSFGQLTALCVSGTLSLRDALKLVTGRARLIKELWGSDSGSMIAIDSDKPKIDSVLAEHEGLGLEIACYNGPQSFVVAGPTSSMDALEASLQASSPEGLRFRRLQVSNAFHSVLTDVLIKPLEQIAEGLTFNEPTIPVETSSEDAAWGKATPALVASHTRTPVFFTHAVERISKELGPCTWVEAGTAGTGAPVLRKALGSARVGTDSVRGLNLDSSTPSALRLLAETTSELWKADLRVQFWPFHHTQQHQYGPLSLPPYQFDKSRHWLEWKDVEPRVEVQEIERSVPEPSSLLIQLSNNGEGSGEFKVNTTHDSWQKPCAENRVLGVSVCPSSLLVNLLSKAVDQLKGVAESALSSSYTVHQLRTQGFILANPKDNLNLTISASGPGWWVFTLQSSVDVELVYASGSLSDSSVGTSLEQEAEFARFQRLVTFDQIKAVSDDVEAESVRGKAVYKSLTTLFQPPQQTVRQVALKGDQAVGYLTTAPSSSAENAFGLVDELLQVPFISLNSLQDHSEDEVYVNTALGEVKWSSSFSLDTPAVSGGKGLSLGVFARFFGINEQETTCDIFVYDVPSSQLILILLDVSYTKVPIGWLQGELGDEVNKVPTSVPKPRLESKALPPRPAVVPNQGRLPKELPKRPILPTTAPAPRAVVEEKKREVVIAEVAVTPAEDLPRSLPSFAQPPSGLPDLTKPISDLLIRVADLELTELPSNLLIADLGIDSLMGMEVAAEISKVFSVDVEMREFMAAIDVASVCKLVASKSSSYSYSSEESSRAASEILDSFDKAALVTPYTDFSSDDERLDSSMELKKNQETEDEEEDSVLHALDAIRHDFDIYARETGCDKFWSQIYPHQAALIATYIVEAFSKLGCDLSALKAGEKVPRVQRLPKQEQLMVRLMSALRDEGLVTEGEDDSNREWFRTSKPASTRPSSLERYEKILADFPQFAPEHKLLHAIGSNLAGCLSGEENPLSLLFGTAERRQMMAEQYTVAPFQASISKQLGSFIAKCFSTHPRPLSKADPLRILEIGGGTCGTTVYVLNALSKLGVPVEYTFTDISSAFVSAAKTKLAEHKFVKYRTMDITQHPESELVDHFDMILGTNVFHATPDVCDSSRNAKTMLRPGGFLLLVEYTRSYYYLDMIFGQLDGWWAFNDGREHALQTVAMWEHTFRRAGFSSVDWTGGRTEESELIRILVAC